MKMTLEKLLKNQEFPKELFDKNGNEIYWENINGDCWVKKEFDSNNNEIYCENSDGFWEKREFDSNNNRIYYGDSNRFWVKGEFDSNNNRIYCEYSDGTILDNRPKEVKRLTHKEICELIGFDVEIIKEKE